MGKPHWGWNSNLFKKLSFRQIQNFHSQHEISYTEHRTQVLWNKPQPISMPIGGLIVVSWGVPNQHNYTKIARDSNSATIVTFVIEVDELDTSFDAKSSLEAM